MAVYRRVDDLTVTSRLTACTPGPAPGPTLGIEYGKPLPFLLVIIITTVNKCLVCYYVILKNERRLLLVTFEKFCFSFTEFLRLCSVSIVFCHVMYFEGRTEEQPISAFSF